MIRIEKIYPGEQLSLDPRESAFSHGIGVFESIQITEGQLQFWSRHWSRLSSSVLQLFSCELSLADESASLEAIKEYYLNLGQKDLVLKLSFVVLAAGPILYVYSRERLDTDISNKLCLDRTYSINKNAVYQGHKTHNYFENISLLKEAKASGYADYLRANTKGEICETCVGNCFFLKGEQIITTPTQSGLFPGVIRDVLIECLPVEIRPISMENLKVMDGCFVTNSIVGILPILEIAGFPDESVLSFSKSSAAIINEVASTLKTIAKSESINLS
ncbi:MAG: aminotransferase class IV [Coraliomargaritaceae bacterium]